MRNALALRGPVEAIVHSDRGSEFRSHAYFATLRQAQLTGSMGRVGACADNAAMESFFSLLQKNVGSPHRRSRDVLPGEKEGHIAGRIPTGCRLSGSP